MRSNNGELVVGMGLLRMVGGGIGGLSMPKPNSCVTSQSSTLDPMLVAPFQAMIFDMDGLLSETESLWRTAERHVASELGFSLSDQDLESTMGLRIEEVVRRWNTAHPWGETPTESEVVERVVDSVTKLSEGAKPLPGVFAAVDLGARLGARLALCSSSHERLIHSVLNTLGLRGRFEVIHSAETDAHGKPHPAPYLATARKLGVVPGDCLALEDSLNGCLSAASAGMTVIAVPHSSERGSAKFGFAHATLESLEDLNSSLLERLRQGIREPTLSRPRFHLAFPVHDLELAREFYLHRLGCTEGRSSSTWVDFDFYGHQIVAHLAEQTSGSRTQTVDGEEVPVRHFGLVLPIVAWEALVERLRQFSQAFLVEPQTRFERQPGEQRTFFLLDPSGNAVEFKAFADDRRVFARSARRANSKSE